MPNRRWRRIGAAIALCLLAACWLAACEAASVATPAPATITVVGSTSMHRVLRDLADEFSRQHSNLLVVLRGGGSTLGEEVIQRGEADLAASTLLPPEEEESRAAPDQAYQLVRTPIGLNGLAIVVHPGNVIEELSLVQLRDIFSGQVLDWQSLGSNEGEIMLVSREDGSGSRILFEGRVMGDERVSLTAVVMPTSADVVEYVAQHPQAIGYVSRGEVAEWIDPDDSAAVTPAPGATMPVKVVRLEGLLPSKESLRSQQYALTEPLYLISRGAPSGRVRQFIDFVLSPTGQSIVARYHTPIR